MVIELLTDSPEYFFTEAVLFQQSAEIQDGGLVGYFVEV